MLCRRSNCARARHAFTLIEVLVVLALACLLIAIVLPGLSRAREAAREVRCAAQARSIAIATFAYGSEHRAMPVSREYGPVAQVAPDRRAWHCPCDVRMKEWQRGSSYAYQGLGGMGFVDWSRPDRIRGDIAWRRFEEEPTRPLYKECGGPYGHVTVAYLMGNVEQVKQ